MHPLQYGIEPHQLRPGLRSWVAPRRSLGFAPQPTDATATVGDTGAVTLAAAVGAHLRGGRAVPEGHEVLLSAVECALADFLGLLRATAAQLHVTDYDLQFNVEWTDPGTPLEFLLPTRTAPFVGDESRETVHFVPVRATLAVGVDDGTFHRDAYELARDCANQAATRDPIAFRPPPAE